MVDFAALVTYNYVASYNRYIIANIVIIPVGRRRANAKVYYFSLRRKKEKFRFGKDCALVNMLLFFLATTNLLH